MLGFVPAFNLEIHNLYGVRGRTHIILKSRVNVCVCENLSSRLDIPNPIKVLSSIIILTLKDKLNSNELLNENSEKFDVESALHKN